MFDGLLTDTENNAIVMELLFELATWHALAKLRLHTESTLHALESSTTRLGTALRKFVSTTCEQFETRNLPSEDAARGRRKAALRSKKKATIPRKKATTKGKRKERSPKKDRRRHFGFSCYKPHSLADYAKAIRMFGTTDSYSTQTVCYSIFFVLRFTYIYPILGGA